MSVSKFNAEGYYDPTPFEALSNMEKKSSGKKDLKLIYVCSPFKGNVDSYTTKSEKKDVKEYNLSRAKGYSLFVSSLGHIPLAPHLLFPQFLDDEDKEEREMGLSYALYLLEKCDEIWVFGCKVSEGMQREIKKAKRMNMPIRYFNDRCQEVKSL